MEVCACTQGFNYKCFNTDFAYNLDLRQEKRLKAYFEDKNETKVE